MRFSGIRKLVNNSLSFIPIRMRFSSIRKLDSSLPLTQINMRLSSTRKLECRRTRPLLPLLRALPVGANLPLLYGLAWRRVLAA